MKMDFYRYGLARATLLSLFFFSQFASAALLKIIHTNDLHSHFEHGSDQSRGHYAAVKAVIDELKYDAWNKGLETLVVDAGDFSEGTQFYLADRGEQSWKALNVMNYDAVVIGNHDYLQGQKDLDKLIANVKPDFFLLGANFSPSKEFKSLRKAMVPRARLERNGDWISVMGLTTDEFMYTWRVGKGTITAPKAAVEKYVPGFRKDSKFVIAVTHLGLAADRKLVRQTKGIDLIVGGHSHDALHAPVYEYSLDGKRVPIVQAGEHGQYVGELLVDLVPGKPVRVVSYRLVPVDINGPKNREMADFVAEARQRLEAAYPRSWLTQQIGYSSVPLEKPKGGKSVWGDVVGEGMRRIAKADIAFNAADLFGDNLPPGPITRERLIQYYPRVFEFRKFTTGWAVWTAEVEGWILKYFVQEVVRQGFDIAVTGASYIVSGAKGKEHVSHFKVGGRSVTALKTYKIALPEGIARVLANDYYKSKLLEPISCTNVSIWAAMELQLRRMGGVVN